MSLNKTDISNWFRDLQDKICYEIEDINGRTRFMEDIWERKEGGGGITRIIQSERIIEKGGVNFSAVYGPLSDYLASALSVSKRQKFYATGVSIVLHAVSPLVPIIHMNVRYFELSDGTYWFGGGIDVTPHYVVPEDAKNFHQLLQQVCKRHDSKYYQKFKQWADDYFYIKHRGEMRGIGGIFFDNLTENKTHSKEKLFEFVKDVGNSFMTAYNYFINRYAGKPYSTTEKNWQYIRRSRYAEFNLIYDRGTKFGLESDGRIESILMSLPPTVKWLYNYSPTEGSREAETLSFLKQGIDWANYQL